ncbi:MAG: hypothetical protein ABI175_15920, partial [Polyangiales bacterium]
MSRGTAGDIVQPLSAPLLALPHPPLEPLLPDPPQPLSLDDEELPLPHPSLLESDLPQPSSLLLESDLLQLLV